MKPKLRRFLGLAVILLAGGCCSTRQGRVQETEITIQQPAPAKTTPADADRAKQLVRRGRQYYDRGKLNEAEKALKTATEIDPRNNEAWYFLDRVRREMDGKHSNEMYHRDVQDEITFEPNQSCQPTPGFRLVAIHTLVAPERLHSALCVIGSL